MCEFVTFPARRIAAPNCSTAPMTEESCCADRDDRRLTVQAFPPGAPYVGPVGKDFQPFGVGLSNSTMGSSRGPAHRE